MVPKKKKKKERKSEKKQLDATSMSIIPAIWKAEIRRIMVQVQPRQKSL
jgi:hypothetical protein